MPNPEGRCRRGGLLCPSVLLLLVAVCCALAPAPGQAEPLLRGPPQDSGDGNGGAGNEAVVGGRRALLKLRVHGDLAAKGSKFHPRTPTHARMPPKRSDPPPCKPEVDRVWIERRNGMMLMGFLVAGYFAWSVTKDKLAQVTFTDVMGAVGVTMPKSAPAAGGPLPPPGPAP